MNIKENVTRTQFEEEVRMAVTFQMHAITELGSNSRMQQKMKEWFSEPSCFEGLTRYIYRDIFKDIIADYEKPIVDHFMNKRNKENK